eukprot:GHVS01005527.1.p1 GENE.GHVS01005527.1~~GHVS01005527.1.p1  ORF type:complete len:359 (+),score=13.71 GHVS01005527.1:99-1175(+)
MAAPLKPWQVRGVCPNSSATGSSVLRGGVESVSPGRGADGSSAPQISAAFEASSNRQKLSEAVPPWSATPSATSRSSVVPSSRNGTSSTTETQSKCNVNVDPQLTYTGLSQNTSPRGLSYVPSMNSSAPVYSSYGNYGRYYGSHNGRYDYSSRQHGQPYGYDSYGGFGSGYGRSPPMHMGSGAGAYGLSGAEDSWFGRVADGLGRFSHILDMNTWFLDQICDTGGALVHRFRSIGSHVGSWATDFHMNNLSVLPFIHRDEKRSVDHEDEWSKLANMAGFSKTSTSTEERPGDEHQVTRTSERQLTTIHRRLRFSTLLLMFLFAVGLWKVYAMWRRYRTTRRHGRDGPWDAIYTPPTIV